MFNFICRTFPHVRFFVRTSPTHNLFSILHHPLSSSTHNSISKTSNQHSFTVSYLINSCGFPPKKALSASNYMNFETPDKPDSVIAFFKNHGFTETQISNLVNGFPPVLLCHPENTLLPKLEFFNSLGFSSTEVAKIITSTPCILKRSLENQIIPSLNFLKNFIQSDEKTIAAIKRFPMILAYKLESYVARNIEILRQVGVPDSNILALLTNQHRAFLTDSDRFRKTVEEVKIMGFNPFSMKFVLAVRVVEGMRKVTWEKKMEAYKKWGLSEDEILVAFGKHPGCMKVSEDKIKGVMDFLVNKMGWQSSVVARRPTLISMSLEKRIIPRCSVYKVLLSKGLIKKNCRLTWFLDFPEKQFQNKIIKSYGEEAPQLLKLYQEKLDLS